MKAKILINFNDKIIMFDGSTPLSEFQDYIDSLDLVEQKRVKKMIKNFTYQYLDLFPKNERKQILTPKDTITISKTEYKELLQIKDNFYKLMADFQKLREEVKELRLENQQLRLENQQLKSVCDKYFKKYGELDLDEKENKNNINKER